MFTIHHVCFLKADRFTNQDRLGTCGWDKQPFSLLQVIWSPQNVAACSAGAPALRTCSLASRPGPVRKKTIRWHRFVSTNDQFTKTGLSHVAKVDTQHKAFFLQVCTLLSRYGGSARRHREGSRGNRGKGQAGVAVAVEGRHKGSSARSSIRRRVCLHGTRTCSGCR